jgi:hypothetical protein
MFAIDVRKGARIVACVAAFVGIIAVLSACGESDSKGASAATISQRPSAHTVQRCLAQHGATRATTVEDLDVLLKAEEEDEVSKPGFGFEKARSVMVEILTGPTSEGRPAPWMYWAGQVFGEDLTPEEIVLNKPPKSFVMYVTSAKKRRAAERCITFSGKPEGPPTEINLQQLDESHG